MVCRRHVATFWVLCLLGNAFCVPTGVRRTRGYADNELDFSKESTVLTGSGDSLATASEDVSSSSSSTSTLDPFDDDDDDDAVFSEAGQTSSSGGSNILSLLRLAGALFPSASGSSPLLRHVKRELAHNQGHLSLRRSVVDNKIDIDNIKGLKPPPFQRQEIEEDSEHDSSESEDSDGDDNSNGDEDSNGDDDENNSAEESLENGNGGNSKASDQEPDDDDDDYSDEPPEGDGQGGGILGILASLSGGEDGQSDLGSLLATVSGIVVNLSGDGIDVNALIATALGLFVGLLSEGEENPGAVIASYLLTSLDTLTGGGANNNGAFFGNLVSKLVKGTSADRNDQQQPSSPIWTLKMDILRAFLQFGTNILGQASAGSTNAITV